ncbi:MAG: type VI secretion system-associated protein TagF [Gammaproteobacteria bacterium]|nr:type VI secretion system-associated protein TagF [Gammaproteobacteria bacterium]
MIDEALAFRLGQESPGFYGKIPVRGDFVSRRLAQHFVEPWDHWLQESLLSSQEQLADDWLDVYLTSPVWRFVMTKGVCGSLPWAGVVMPSVDRMGRYFPFTLATPLAEGVNPFRMMQSGGAWYAQAETLALSSLREGFELEEFDQQLKRLRVPKSAAKETVHNGIMGASSAWHISLAAPSSLAGACSELANQALEELYFGYSLWWSHGSEQVEPSFLVCQGLPPTTGFAAMLGGDWENADWQKRSVTSAHGDGF